MEETFIAVRDQVVADRFGEETFLVNFRNGRYYAMRGVAGLIWQHLDRPQSPTSMLDQLRAAFGSSLPETAQVDVGEFLALLNAQGLVTASAEAAPDVVAPSDAAATAYTSPVLEIFDDLSELISVDPVHEVDNERGWPVQPK